MPTSANLCADSGSPLEPQSDADRRSFLRTVGHELRNPLNSVIGFAEIVSSEAYGPLGAPQYKEYAEMIRKSGYQLLKLVNQIVDIAKLEGRAMDLLLEPESLDFALDDALISVQQEVADRKLKVVVENEGALPSVMADSRGLRTMLVNLLQNAVFFSPKGGTVTIRAETRGDQVCLEIRDRGDGVPVEEIARLLKPFEQGDNAHELSAPGVGLGLPIVNLLSQAMGGSLHLDSAPGKGMAAIISLPAA